jgi:hypothetical protein
MVLKLKSITPFLKTAFFAILPNVHHGDELICSYPACRDTGARLCFCLECRIPVAKRNFRIRHNHCDFPPPASAIAAGQEAESSTGGYYAASSSNVKIPGAWHLPAYQEALKKRHRRAPKKTTTAHYYPRAMITASSAFSTCPEDSIDSRDSRQPSKRRMVAWDRLLGNRPRQDDVNRMTAWLESISSVSNMDVPLEQQEEASCYQRATTDAASKKRPKGTREEETTLKKCKKNKQSH